MSAAIRGYAEGYYGRLLSWNERSQILDCLQQHGMNTYYYAPKEDACHRWQWRTPYDQQWRGSFRAFCAQARERNVAVIAGVAPGIDFNFSHLADGEDFQILQNKCKQLLCDGASGISLLLDDIDADFHNRDGGIASEGLAHALLANELSAALQQDNQSSAITKNSGEYGRLWVTPRIYADELVSEAPTYLPDFLGELGQEHLVLYCGSDVVTKQLSGTFNQLPRQYSNHRVIVWDNLYANDYCPRRLFLGPWQGRENVEDILLNPTGHVLTDCLLLDMMASHQGSSYTSAAHDEVLSRHGVPTSFKPLLPYFNYPVFNTDQETKPLIDADREVFDAMEECLWRWKADLSREWYPYIFGLKHDLLIHASQLPTLRIHKTQNSPLAAKLLDDR